MRSRVTFTVEHDETTDAFQAFVEATDDEACAMFDEVSFEIESNV